MEYHGTLSGFSGSGVVITHLSAAGHTRCVALNITAESLSHSSGDQSFKPYTNSAEGVFACVRKLEKTKLYMPLLHRTTRQARARLGLGTIPDVPQPSCFSSKPSYTDQPLATQSITWIGHQPAKPRQTVMTRMLGQCR